MLTGESTVRKQQKSVVSCQEHCLKTANISCQPARALLENSKYQLLAGSSTVRKQQKSDVNRREHRQETAKISCQPARTLLENSKNQLLAGKSTGRKQQISAVSRQEHCQKTANISCQPERALFENSKQQLITDNRLFNAAIFCSCSVDDNCIVYLSHAHRVAHRGGLQTVHTVYIQCTVYIRN